MTALELNDEKGYPKKINQSLHCRKLSRRNLRSISDTSQDDTTTTRSSTDGSFSQIDDHDAVWESLRGKLLGREEHQSILVECYKRCLQPQDGMARTEIVIITGAAGTGKSSLARSLMAQAPECSFLTGKCQKESQKEPFAPIIHAFNAFFRQIIQGKDVKDTHRRVVHALEKATRNADPTVLYNMFPILRNFLEGKEASEDDWPVRPMVQVMSSSSSSSANKWSRSRGETPTMTLFCQFLKEFCSIDEPLILLIDDWQWLDVESLKLVEMIALMQKLEGFMLLGTCRGNEVQPQDDLSVILRALEAQGVTITDIPIGPLNVQEVTCCLSRLLNLPESPKLLSLSHVAHKRTEGNPFLVLELFRTLLDQQLIQRIDGAWNWDEDDVANSTMALGSIKMLDVTVEQLVKNSATIADFLKIASCLGSEFDLCHIQHVSNMSQLDTSMALSTLCNRGILVVTGDRLRRRLGFAHDRWRDAAISLFESEDIDTFRLWVGRRLMDTLTMQELTEHIFLVAQLMFEKASEIENQDDRNRVAEVFGLAGTKASKCSAFDDAARYFRKAISLLPKDRWDTPTYRFCLQLYVFSAEIECCLGHAEHVDMLVDEILQNTTELKDQLPAYETKIHSLSVRNQFHDAVKLAYHILNVLDEPMAKRRGVLRDLGDLFYVLRLLRKIREEQVLNLPLMRDWKKLAAMKILHYASPSVIQSNPEDMLHFVLIGVRLSLKYGLAPLSCLQFTSLGMILCNPLFMIDEGLRLEKIGYMIYEKFRPKDLKCRVSLICYAHNRPWREPIQNCIPKILEGAQAGMMTGDVEMAGMNYAHLVVDKLFAGYSLGNLYQETEVLHKKFTELGQQSIVFYFQSSLQLMRNLNGLADNPRILSGEDFDAMKSIEEASAMNYSACLWWLNLCQQFLAVMVGDFAHAVELTRELASLDTTAICGYLYQYLLFLRALSEAILSRDPTANRKNNRACALKALKRLKKLTNYPRPERGWSNKILMVDAELYASKDQRELAIMKWHASIKDAERQDLVHEQGWAHERMGHSLLQWGQESQALIHFREARTLYSAWGCVLKCNQMRQIVGELTASKKPRGSLRS